MNINTFIFMEMDMDMDMVMDMAMVMDMDMGMDKERDKKYGLGHEKVFIKKKKQVHTVAERSLNVVFTSSRLCIHSRKYELITEALVRNCSRSSLVYVWGRGNSWQGGGRLEVGCPTKLVLFRNN
jgi:hypothetical protein